MIYALTARQHARTCRTTCARSDAALQDLSAQLVAEETAFSAAMPDRKRAYYRSSNAQRSRDDDGQARR